MILKLLLIIGVIGVVYFLFIKKKPLKSSSDKKMKKDEKLEANDMVECAECETYVELSESIIFNNKYYCSSECVDKA